MKHNFSYIFSISITSGVENLFNIFLLQYVEIITGQHRRGKSFYGFSLFFIYLFIRLIKFWILIENFSNKQDSYRTLPKRIAAGKKFCCIILSVSCARSLLSDQLATWVWVSDVGEERRVEEGDLWNAISEHWKFVICFIYVIKNLGLQSGNFFVHVTAISHFPASYLMTQLENIAKHFLAFVVRCRRAG